MSETETPAATVAVVGADHSGGVVASDIAPEAEAAAAILAAVRASLAATPNLTQQQQFSAVGMAVGSFAFDAVKPEHLIHALGVLHSQTCTMAGGLLALKDKGIA